MVQSLPRYIVGWTPRVNGGSPGKPSLAAGSHPFRSSGEYRPSIGRLETVVNSFFLSGFLPTAERRVVSSQSRLPREVTVEVRPPFFGFISVLFQDLLGDHHPLDLRRALVDLRDLGVPEQPLHGVLVDVTIAAVDLHAFFRRPHAGLRGEQFGHAGLERAALLLVTQPGGAVREEPGR